jgi:hypothetical protein
VDVVKCYSYLLGQTELFKNFIDIKASVQIIITEADVVSTA